MSDNLIATGPLGRQIERRRDAADLVRQQEAFEHANHVAMVPQLVAIRRAKSALNKADESITEELKRYMPLERLEVLEDVADGVIEQQVACPACLGEPVMIPGTTAVVLSEVGGARWIDWSKLSDEDALWAVRHGLASLNVKALDGLEQMTDPAYIRFQGAVQKGGSSRLEIRKEAKP